VTDRIELRGMRFDGRHGVLPEEATEAQPFDVDVVLELGLAAAGTTDDLARTVDYGDVFRLARAVVEQGPRVALIETLAERIAADVLTANPAIDAVTVRVRKPRAPLPGVFAWAGVEIRRSRFGPLPPQGR
jgi:7,8-dihydroneopterin aldolase/epimerase/oxygenase